MINEKALKKFAKTMFMKGHDMARMKTFREDVEYAFEEYWHKNKKNIIGTLSTS